MLPIYRLQTELEKEEILKTLLDLKDKQRRECNWDSFWHTARMYQSLKKQIIDKNIFVNDMTNIKFVLANFVRIKERISVSFEICLIIDLVDEEVNDIVQILLQFINEVTLDGKICFFRSFPKCLIKKISMNLHNYSFKSEFSQEVVGLYFDSVISDKKSVAPNKFVIRNLDENSIAQVITFWKYGHKNDDDWMKRSVLDVFGLGLWDSDRDKLFGQFLYMLTGVFGGMVIDSEYRGQGLGRYLALEMIEKCQLMGMEMLIEIETDNKISQRLFASLGFKALTNSIYIAFQVGDSVIRPKMDL